MVYDAQRYPKLVGFTQEELETYREITFENTVHFYRDESKRLLQGELAKKSLNKGTDVY